MRASTLPLNNILLRSSSWAVVGSATANEARMLSSSAPGSDSRGPNAAWLASARRFPTWTSARTITGDEGLNSNILIDCTAKLASGRRQQAETLQRASTHGRGAPAPAHPSPSLRSPAFRLTCAPTPPGWSLDGVSPHQRRHPAWARHLPPPPRSPTPALCRTWGIVDPRPRRPPGWCCRTPGSTAPSLPSEGECALPTVLWIGGRGRRVGGRKTSDQQNSSAPRRSRGG